MTRFKLFAAALAFSAFLATPALAQVSEPSAAAAQDPSFSIYSNNGFRGVPLPIVSQPFDANAMAGARMSVTPHHAPIRHH